MNPTKKLPLFCITGASGAGKSTVCSVLFEREKDYAVLESDILWNDFYNTPDDNYRTYRRLWLNLCANISQTGLPCVLCGCCTPEQFESLPEREMFTEIHYLAIVTDDETMRRRMTSGRNITDENWINSSLHFNRWLKTHHASTTPPIDLLDTSNLTPEEAAVQMDAWIRSKL